VDCWAKLKDILKSKPNLRFWWRDDDICTPTAESTRLFQLATEFDIPLVLAVIPEKAEGKLVRHFNEFPKLRYRIWQHGLSHDNRAPEEHRSCELIEPIDLARLHKAKAKLKILFPDHFDPIMVPPWNRYDPDLEPLLLTEFDKISVLGQNHTPHFINVHLNLMKIDAEGFVDQVAKHTQDYLGIMTHHLRHEEQHWDLLKKIFQHIDARRF
jgi:hypothetical protein